LASECTKVDVGRGFAADPTGRAYSDPLDFLAGAASLQEGWNGGRRTRGRTRGGRGEEKGGINSTQFIKKWQPEG